VKRRPFSPAEIAARILHPIGYLRESVEAACFEFDPADRPDLARWYAAYQAGEFTIAGGIWHRDPRLADGRLVLMCTAARPPSQPLSFWLAFGIGPELSVIAGSGLIGIGPRDEPPYLFSVATDPPRRFLEEVYRGSLAS
jgi:hypothetical protein